MKLLFHKWIPTICRNLKNHINLDRSSHFHKCSSQQQKSPLPQIVPSRDHSFLGSNKLDLKPVLETKLCGFHPFREPFTSLADNTYAKKIWTDRCPDMMEFIIVPSVSGKLLSERELVSSLLLNGAFLSFPLGLVLWLSVPINVYICISICTVPHSYQKASLRIGITQ